MLWVLFGADPSPEPIPPQAFTNPTTPPEPSPPEHSAPPTPPTLFGTGLDQSGGVSLEAAFDRSVDAYGRPDVARVFNAGLPPWWGTLSDSVDDTPVVVSFKVPPATVLSGAVDGRLRAWFASAPTNRDTYWIYYHEPEDEIAAGHFTSQQFVDAWERLAALAAQAHNPRLQSTVVLMCWTLAPESGRRWQDYVPAAGLVDVLAWDCYNHGARDGAYLDPETLLGDSVQVSRQVGAQWALSELGSRVAVGDDGTGRAVWLRAVGDYVARQGAAFVTYFDGTVGGDFRLSDAASARAWAGLVRG